jgi:hypothetical protein
LTWSRWLAGHTGLRHLLLERLDLSVDLFLVRRIRPKPQIDSILRGSLIFPLLKLMD